MWIQKDIKYIKLNNINTTNTCNYSQNEIDDLIEQTYNSTFQIFITEHFNKISKLQTYLMDYIHIIDYIYKEKYYHSL